MAVGIKGAAPKVAAARAQKAAPSALNKELQGMPLRVLGFTRQSLQEAARLGGPEVKKSLEPALQAVNQEVERRAAAAKVSPKQFESAIAKATVPNGNWGDI